MTINKAKQTVLTLLLLAILLLTGCSQKAQPELSPAPTPAVPCDWVRISEYMNKNRTTLMDDDGDFSDWIELENISDSPVSLGGWHISDKESKQGWELPEVILPAGERLVIFASGKDRAQAELHTDFSISEDESLYLRDGNGSLCSVAPALGCGADVSAAADEEGVFSLCLYPTPGEENSREGYARLQQAAYPTGPLVINEAVVFTSTQFRNTAPETSLYDWVEIKNISDKTVELSDYYLSNDKDDYSLYRLPRQSLHPGGTAVFLCNDGLEVSQVYPSLPFSLSANSDRLYLSDAAGELVDRLPLRSIPYGCSFGRMDGWGGWFYFTTPTPGADNRDGKPFVAHKPVSSTPGGVFEGVGQVSVTLSGEGEIRYTTDGSMPTKGSPLYTSPLSFGSTCVLRAASFTDDAVTARAVTVPLIINEGHSLPVLSLVSDDTLDFFNMYSNAVKEWEQPGSVAFFDDGEGFSADCGIKMSGQTSLVLPNKSMYLAFRGIYGGKSVSYNIFGGGVTEFTDLQVRAGQNQSAMVFNSELSQDLTIDVTDKVINQRSRYCVLYINGKYWGIYALKEKPNAELYASVAGVNPDSVTFYKAPIAMDTQLYRDVFAFANDNDLSLSENFSAISRALDMDSLIDWMLMEGYCANADLMSSNVAFCMSTENGGQWKLVMYDMDATFHSTNSIYFNILNTDTTQAGPMNFLLSRLLKNADFRERVLSRASELYGGPLRDEELISRIDGYAELLRPEIPRAFEKLDCNPGNMDSAAENLKRTITSQSWRQMCIDSLCYYLKVSGQERSVYFGDY